MPVVPDPGFEDGVDAIELIFKLTAQAEKYGATFKECEVKNVDMGCRPFRVTCEGPDALPITCK